MADEVTVTDYYIVYDGGTTYYDSLSDLTAELKTADASAVAYIGGTISSNISLYGHSAVITGTVADSDKYVINGLSAATVFDEGKTFSITLKTNDMMLARVCLLNNNGAYNFTGNAEINVTGDTYIKWLEATAPVGSGSATVTGDITINLSDNVRITRLRALGNTIGNVTINVSDNARITDVCNLFSSDAMNARTDKTLTLDGNAVWNFTGGAANNVYAGGQNVVAAGTANVTGDVTVKTSESAKQTICGAGGSGTTNIGGKVTMTASGDASNTATLYGVFGTTTVDGGVFIIKEGGFGAVYGLGKGSNYTGAVNFDISGGTLSKAALGNGAFTANGDVEWNISGYTGSAIYAAGQSSDASAASTVNGDVSVTVTGNPGGAVHLAGGSGTTVIDGKATLTVNTEEGVAIGAVYGSIGTTTVNGGIIIDKVAGGKNDSYDQNIYGVASGHYTGNLTININGGQNKRVNAIQSGTITGNVTYNISAGTVRWFEAGSNVNATSIDGDITVNMTGGNLQQFRALSNTQGNVYFNLTGGRMGESQIISLFSNNATDGGACTLTGNATWLLNGVTVQNVLSAAGSNTASATTTVTGDVSVILGGEQDDISKDIMLGSNNYTVKGKSSIVFDGYSKTVSGAITQFGNAVFKGDAAVTLSSASNSFASDSVTFDLTARSAENAGTAMVSGAGSAVLASAAAVNVVVSGKSLSVGTYTLTTGVDWTDKTASITLNGGAWADNAKAFAGYNINDVVYADSTLSFTVTEAVKEVNAQTELENGYFYGDGHNSIVVKSGVFIEKNLYAAANDGATLTVEGGNIKNIFAGAKFEADATTGDITATVGGGEDITTTRIYGGNAVLGGMVETVNTTLTISGALAYQVQKDGVWCYGAGIAASTETTSGTLKITGTSKVEVTAPGSVGSVVGGGRAQGTGSLDVANTSVTISNATVTNAIGGAYNSGSGSVSVGTAEMSISSQNVTTVFGGNFIAPVSDSVDSDDNSITKVNLTLNGAKASNAIFGGNYMKAGEASIENVNITVGENGANAACGIYGGGFIVGAASETITNVNITVSGKVEGNIFAGACVSGVNGSSTVTSANITVEAESDVTGNIYAGGYSVNGTAAVGACTITFSGASAFNGKVCATSAGSVKTDAPKATVVFDKYVGDFGGAFAGTFDVIEFTADSSVNFNGSDNIIFDGLKTDAVQITGMDTVTYSADADHVLFSLGSRSIDISKISVNGGTLEKIEDVLSGAFTYYWNDTTNTFGYVGANAIKAENKGDYKFYQLTANA